MTPIQEPAKAPEDLTCQERVRKPEMNVSKRVGTDANERTSIDGVPIPEHLDVPSAGGTTGFHFVRHPTEILQSPLPMSMSLMLIAVVEAAAAESVIVVDAIDMLVMPAMFVISVAQCQTSDRLEARAWIEMRIMYGVVRIVWGLLAVFVAGGTYG